MAIVKVKGEASKLVNADLIEYSFYIQGEGITNSDAVKDNIHKTNKLINGLTSLGLLENELHVKDDDVSDSTNRDSKTKIHKRTIGFAAKYNPILVANISNLVSEMEGITYSTSQTISDMNKYRSEILIEALNNSRTIADAIAKANNRKVVGIESVADNKYADYDDYNEIRGGSVKDVLLLDDLITNISSKQITIVEEVNVSWIIG